ncbi:hypothetical protein SPIRO4BDMA_50048 [uncultured spirochete]|uniref:Uncharacterized protein n=1 Tax=uncultured spirochete TaxID=156406 RepID=A0A3P3XRQ5_9SPIR|nr:hypothetical protein SPIRO4BDMA_50048 [uncultured spirochete]
MICEEFHAPNRKRRDQPCEPFHVFLIVIHSGDDGNPYGHIHVGARELLEVFEYPLVSGPNDSSMPFGIEGLEVEKDMIEKRQAAFDRAPRDVSGSLDYGIDASRLHPLKQRLKEIDLEKWFPARKSYSPPGGGVKLAILQHFAVHLIDTHPFPFHRERTSGADLDAGTTQDTGAAIDPSLSIIVAADGLRGAGFETGVASDTTPRDIEQFGFEPLRFGVCTPQTAERTTFEKDDGPDSRTVMD